MVTTTSACSPRWNSAGQSRQVDEEAAFLADPVVLQADTGDGAGEDIAGTRAQPHFGGLADGEIAGAGFVDEGLDPHRRRVDQGEEGFAGIHHRAEFAQTGDHHAVEGRDQTMALEQHLVEDELGAGGIEADACDFDVALGDRLIGHGDTGIHFRLFGGFHRDGVTFHQRLAAFVDLALLAGDHLGAFGQRFGLGESRLGGADSGARLGNTRLLLAILEAGEKVSLGDAIAVIDAQFDQRGSGFEAELRGDAGLLGAEAEDAHRDVLDRGGDIDCKRSGGVEAEHSEGGGGDAHDNEGDLDGAVHGLSPGIGYGRSDETGELQIEQVCAFGNEIEAASGERPTQSEPLEQAEHQQRGIRRRCVQARRERGEKLDESPHQVGHQAAKYRCQRLVGDAQFVREDDREDRRLGGDQGHLGSRQLAYVVEWCAGDGERICPTSLHPRRDLFGDAEPQRIAGWEMSEDRRLGDADRIGDCLGRQPVRPDFGRQPQHHGHYFLPSFVRFLAHRTPGG